MSPVVVFVNLNTQLFGTVTARHLAFAFLACFGALLISHVNLLIIWHLL
jgi:hypothetical protein